MSLFRPEYAISVGVAVALALLFPVTKHLRGGERRSYYTLQTITLVGAVVGAKLSVLLGDYDWPFVPMRDWHQILVSGRSVTGALILGFLAAETAKPLLGYRLPPNDRFATLLPFSCAIGRVGCLLTGCCRGSRGTARGRSPTRTASPAIRRRPTSSCSSSAVGLTFLALLRRGRLHGRLFSVYLIAYGAFRFAIEFVRETPKTWGPISPYQGLSLVMIALGTAFLVKRTFWPPEAWQNTGPAPLAA